jgi:hypothetical protein
MLSLAPQYLRSSRTKNLRISFEIRARWPPLPDGDHQWHRCCDGGGGEGRLCDHCRSGAFLLVGLGRVPQFSQLLRGKLRAGGRKPWLATTFGTLLASP